MTLINYVKTAMNKRLLLSESRGDSNWCTPYGGKPDTHGMYTFCASPCTSLIRFQRAIPVRGNLSHWPNRIGLIHYSREKVLSNPLHCPAEWPGGPALVSLPNTAIEAVCLSQTSVDEHDTSVYWAHISRMWSVRSILARRGQPIGH
jgi:hypothetical protein